jgi:hypothetical protein
MSSPQQPWSPDQPAASGPPEGYGAPQGYGGPQGYGAPASGATPGPLAEQGFVPLGYGAPQVAPEAYGSGPTGELVINLKAPVGSMGMITPLVTIDGHPATARWGRNAFPAPAGLRQVEAAQTYLGTTYGRASIAVPVEPDRTSEIFFAGPMTAQGKTGAIGFTPQKRPGRAVFVGMMLFLFVLLLVVVLAVVVGNS